MRRNIIYLGALVLFILSCTLSDTGIAIAGIVFMVLAFFWEKYADKIFGMK